MTRENRSLGKWISGTRKRRPCGRERGRAILREGLGLVVEGRRRRNTYTWCSSMRAILTLRDERRSILRGLRERISNETEWTLKPSTGTSTLPDMYCIYAPLKELVSSPPVPCHVLHVIVTSNHAYLPLPQFLILADPFHPPPLSTSFWHTLSATCCSVLSRRRQAITALCYCSLSFWPHRPALDVYTCGT